VAQHARARGHDREAQPRRDEAFHGGDLRALERDPARATSTSVSLRDPMGVCSVTTAWSPALARPIVPSRPAKGGWSVGTARHSCSRCRSIQAMSSPSGRGAANLLRGAPAWRHTSARGRVAGALQGLCRYGKPAGRSTERGRSHRVGRGRQARGRSNDELNGVSRHAAGIRHDSRRAEASRFAPARPSGHLRCAVADEIKVFDDGEG
jgi:hypothetical protein